MNRPTVWRVVDILWLVGLAIYILAGIEDVPFHGDESTIIFMSRDYHYLVQERDLDPVLYRAAPADPAEQDVRIVNGTVSKMAIGLAWDAAGLTVDDLNGQWLWGTGWDSNVQEGHVPGDRLLRVARWSSALLLVISAWAVFGIAWMVVSPPPRRDFAGPDPWAEQESNPRLSVMRRATAYAASAIYTTTPTVLMNGRRAMFEGAHLCFVLLAVLAAIMLIREQQNPEKTRRTLAGWAILTGLLGGVALASKHTAVLAVGLIFLALFTEPLIRPTPPRSLPLTVTERIRTYNVWRIARFIVMGLLVIGVFVLLTPAWWSDPLDMPGIVFEARRELLRGQGSNYNAHKDWGARVFALAENTFWAAPQYYESGVWRDYAVIRDQIADYDGSWLAGRNTNGSGGTIWGAALVIAFALGIGVLVLHGREGPAWLVWVWLMGTAVFVLVTTTLNWQRYYLPLQPIMAVIAGAGVGWVVGTIRPGQRRRA